MWVFVVLSFLNVATSVYLLFGLSSTCKQELFKNSALLFECQQGTGVFPFWFDVIFFVQCLSPTLSPKATVYEGQTESSASLNLSSRSF